MLERVIGLYGWQGQAASPVYVVSFTVTLQVWSHSLNFTPHINFWISEFFDPACTVLAQVVELKSPLSGTAQFTLHFHCSADREVGDQQLAQRYLIEMSYCQDHLPQPTLKHRRAPKCKFTHFITVNHIFTSTWGCSHSCYEAGLRLRFGVLFHAQNISERARFCRVTTDTPGHCTTLMQNNTSTLTCYMLVSTIIIAFELDLHLQKHSISSHIFNMYKPAVLVWHGLVFGSEGGYKFGFHEKLPEASNMSSRASSWWLQRWMCHWPRLGQSEMVATPLW